MPPDKALTKECDDPVLLPERELTQEEVERFWITDRKALIVCRKRHGGVVWYYAERDSRLVNR